MTDETDLPEPDRVEGVPHPRETPRLFGHGAAEAAFLATFNTGRLHHAWLLSGPLGVGKATMAWRIARFLLATPPQDGGGLFGEALPPPETLDIPQDHPVMARTRALSEPGLFLLRRGWAGNTDSEREKSRKAGKLSNELRVYEVRQLASFLHMSASEGGRRVVIVDCADEMNTSAANALLKMLEEPPALTTFLMVSHQPSRLLPTIRSRCRELRLGPVDSRDMHAALAQAGAETDESPELAELAAGSVGEALRLVRLGGVPLYADIVALFATLPRMDRQRALGLADMAAAGGSEKFELMLNLIDLFLARLARTGATGQPPASEAAPNEAATLSRLAPDQRSARAWADVAQEVSTRTRHGKAVNLDPAALVLDTVFRIQKTATA